MKTNIIFALQVLFAFVVNAQNAIQWQNTIGGNNNDNVTSIQQTADGGYIIGGNSSSNISGDKTENRLDSLYVYQDYWVIKLDSSGNIQWQNTIGGNRTDILAAVQQTTDGGYILGGSSSSTISGDKTEDTIGYTDYWVVKLHSSGNIQWQNTIGGNHHDFLNSIQQTTDGGYILGGQSYSNISGDKTEDRLGGYDYWVVKLDVSGNIQWQNTITGNLNDVLITIQQTSDGGYILGGDSDSGIAGDKTEPLIDVFQPFNDMGDFWVLKLDVSGNIQWQNTIGGDAKEYLGSIRQTSDGGYILGGESGSGVSGDKTEDAMGSSDYWVIKLDVSGNIIWQNTIGGNSGDGLNEIQQTNDGGYILGGTSISNNSGDKTENSLGGSDYWVVKIDTSGNIQWQNTIGGNSSDALATVQQTTDGGYILAGHSTSNISGDKTENSLGGNDYWIVKLMSATNLIQGNVFEDLNSNCVNDSAEINIKGFLLQSEPWQNFTTTDSLGNYELWVDTGSYTIRLLTAGPYLNLQCPATGLYNFNFTGTNNISSGTNFGFEKIAYCPWMEVDIAAPVLRICRSSAYAVQYCNLGTAIANNVSIEVEVDSFIIVNGSSIPWSLPQSGNTFIFNVGDVGIRQCGSFLIYITVDCAATAGLTQCATAHIYPDSICLPPGTTWDGSSVQVGGRCSNTNDTVLFFIQNVGANAMQDSLDYYIVEDNVMLRTKKFKLPSGGIITPFELANGSTWRLEAQQSIGHPGRSKPSVTVEACGTNGTGGVSQGFVTTLPEDDYNPFISIDCQEVRASCDPNEKFGYPKGVDAQKFITSEDELDYRIHFQNTGNDTAFLVVIRDTLSPYLDLATVVPGASSHPYDFRIYDTGILEWTFQNILLPDSNVNEPGSHGFVKFRVAQKPGNLPGTVIHNQAAIYFDFNAPVLTNTEYNTIGERGTDFLVWNGTPVIINEGFDRDNNILLYPNPFHDELNIEIESQPLENVEFEVYNLQGRKIFHHQISNTNQFSIANMNLSKGMYLYRLTADGNLIGSGKIIGQ